MRPRRGARTEPANEPMPVLNTSSQGQQAASTLASMDTYLKHFIGVLGLVAGKQHSGRMVAGLRAQGTLEQRLQ